MSQRGAPAAYRGYRLQALYTLSRLLASGQTEDLRFHPEGWEDLSIRTAEGAPVEAVQVKSYTSLVLSDLKPSEQGSFFRRVVDLVREHRFRRIKLVNFGAFGPEMGAAWAGNGRERQQVTSKLLSEGFSQVEADLIFAHVELVALDEVRVTDEVYAYLQNELTGVQPQSAFDLLHFWLYLCSEERTEITRPSLIAQIANVGRFLAERHAHHREWFTSIVPLSDEEIPDEQVAYLKDEFYAGVSVRYEHILAGLDFRRESGLAEVAGAFKTNRVVIVRAASGQGKTTLAYRYLHDYYPGQWRFQVRAIENRQHALTIARALEGHAAAVGAPMAVYIDVSQRDTDWPELARELSRYPHFQVLVTIREEDLQRSNVSGAEFQYSPVRLRLDEAEARQLYDRAVASGQCADYLSFEDAWSRFGGGGPLMEFVFLLTHAATLEERLRQQIYRIREGVRDLPSRRDELRLLRLVSVAGGYEARLDVPSLVRELDLPDADHTLHEFEEEYLIRRSADGHWVGAVHPVRSRILAGLLTSADVEPWACTAEQAVRVMVEDDIETFLLYALVDRPTEGRTVLESASRQELATWRGLAGILRVLLWSGLRDYLDGNAAAIDAAYQDCGRGWSVIIDLDPARLEPADLWEQIRSSASPDRRSRMEELRSRQTPLEEALQRPANWLPRLQRQPAPPLCRADWLGAAELCYWSGHFHLAPHVERWLSDSDLDQAIGQLGLTDIAHLSLALHTCNPARRAVWIQRHLSTIESRLAQEYNVLSLENAANGLQVHFVPFLAEDGGGRPMHDGGSSSDPLHDETIERIQLVRGLFPEHPGYGSQGYGYKFSVAGPFDHSTTKEGIPVSMLPPPWAVRVNSIARGLGDHRFRPDSWPDYVGQVMQMRESTLSCLQHLLAGLRRYLERASPVDLYGTLGDELTRCWSMLHNPPLLPKSAVDPWGFACEGQATQPGSLLGGKELLLKPVALSKYAAFLKAQREYTSSLDAFLWRALNVMVCNYHTGRLNPSSASREDALSILQQAGVKTDVAWQSAYYLSQAADSLREYHQQFRTIFASAVDARLVHRLEMSEEDLVNRVWALWYFYATRPEQKWSNPERQIANLLRVTKRQLDERVEEVLQGVSADGTCVSIMPVVEQWDGEPTLWLQLDVENPSTLYADVERLIVALRRALQNTERQSIAERVIEQHWRYVAIVPTVRGRSLSSSAWRLRTATTILPWPQTELTASWSYVLRPIPPVCWQSLGLDIWGIDDLRAAGELSGAALEMAVVAARLAEVCNTPDPTEAGLQVRLGYLDRQAKALSKGLRRFVDACSILIERARPLASEELRQRPSLQDALSGASELLGLVAQSEESSGEERATTEQILQWAQQLERARPLAEVVAMCWIADIIDHQAT